MNLHDITIPMANIDLIAAYCSQYYAMEFVVADGRRSLEYRSYAEGAWAELSERDTLSYSNAALEWDHHGRQPR